MTEKHTLTVVINVFDDKYCDVYFFTPEHKKWCADLMCSNAFTSFVYDSMYYPLFNIKHDNPEIDLKSHLKNFVRTYLNALFGRVHDMNINSYLDFSQSYSLEPAFDIDDCVMQEVYVCDYRIGKLYISDTFYNRTPSLYRADELVCDDDCTFHLVQEDLDDVISTVKRCGDELETFAELSLYAVKDDRGIEVCPFSVGNKDYFVQKAKEHANDKNYLVHKTYVYEYKNGKTNKIYGCCRFNEASKVVVLNLEKDEDRSSAVTKQTEDSTSNSFVFVVDEERELSDNCSAVSVLYKKSRCIIKAKFPLNQETERIWNNREENGFSIGSKHKISLCLIEQKGVPFVEYSNCVLSEIFFTVSQKELDKPFEIELTFEAE